MLTWNDASTVTPESDKNVLVRLYYCDENDIFVGYWKWNTWHAYKDHLTIYGQWADGTIEGDFKDSDVKEWAYFD